MWQAIIVWYKDQASLYKVMEAISFEDNIRLPIFTTIIKISYRCAIIMLLWLPIFLVCLPLYLLGLSIWGLPPIISPWSRFVKYFVAAFTAGRAEDNIPFINRVSVFLMVFTTLLKVPLAGICWYVDELLFSKYHRVTIKEPIFFITGSRTGSTQLSHYFEDDKINFIAPTWLELFIPFIWCWKFVFPVLKAAGIMKIHGRVAADKDFGQPQKELYKRQTIDVCRTGTFDLCAFWWHFDVASWYLGVDFMKWGFPFVKPTEKSVDNQFCSSFMQLNNSVMKKVIYHRGTPTQRVIVKGHFLMVADELAQRYKGAKFFTVVREPLDRFKSTINFFKVVSIEKCAMSGYPVCPTSWKVLRGYVIDTQVAYCAEEQLFYENSRGNKLVIPFNKFVNNLSATLKSVYSFCNISIPSHVLTNAGEIQNTTHNCQKRRASYDPKFNRSLSSLGVDEHKLRDQLTDYYQWIKQYDET